VRSGLRAVAYVLKCSGSEYAYERLQTLFDCGDRDPIGAVLEQDASPVDKSELLRVYREHEPELQLADAIEKLLTRLVNEMRPMGIITDGRSVTQRNKISALGLDKWIDEIVISEEFGSEKPATENYRHFERVFPDRSYAYIGDNVLKDFVAPNRLGWSTIGLRDGGQNIHTQPLESVPPDRLPQYMIDRIA